MREWKPTKTRKEKIDFIFEWAGEEYETEEEREAKVAKTYLGNGKVVWMSPDGVTVAERDDQPQAVAEPASDDLPF